MAMIRAQTDTMYPLLRSSSRNLLTVSICAALFLGLSVAIPAQDSAAKPAAYNKVIGEVTAVDASGAKMSVKQDNGTVAEVPLDANTAFMLVPAGEKDLHKATRIELKDVVTGDRVYARSRKAEGQSDSPAVSVIVMSHAQVAQQQNKSREEWQTRGAAGKVTAVDPAAKTITLSLQSLSGAKTLVVDTDEKTVYRRYAPDSVKFSDAQPSHFTDVAVGNNVRVLGDKNADGTQIHAEQLLSGSFRNIAGTVLAVDATAGQIKLNDLITKKPVTVTVNADTNLRKLPPFAANMIARAQNRGSAAAPGSPAAAPAEGATHEGGGGHMDPSQMLERAPKFALADLKAGDALVISSSSGPDSSAATAIAVIAGVEPILAAAPAGSGRRGSGAGSGADAMWSLDMAMPQ